MLKMCDGYGILDIDADEYYGIVYTSSDIKEIVKAENKDGKDTHYVDVIQKDYILVAMDSNGNGFYLPKEWMSYMWSGNEYHTQDFAKKYEYGTEVAMPHQAHSY